MLFSKLATYFEQLEKTASRNTMTEILAKLFEEVGKEEIDKVCYLLQGRVAPLYEPIEFGMADKMVVRAIVQGLGVGAEEVNRAFKQLGDLGNTAENIKYSRLSGIHDAVNAHSSQTASGQKSNIAEIYEILFKLAKTSGMGSQEGKVNLLADLIKSIDPLSARYIVRMVLAKLRLGFSDMTILDALSWMLTGSKSVRKVLEKAYHVRPDLGYIAKTAKERGEKGLNEIKPEPGTPILMARANRLSSPKEIMDKIGECAVESKYDGLRLQVHYKKCQIPIRQLADKCQDNKEKYLIKMFSRNLEDITDMFPDVEEAVLKQIMAESAILEGEVVAYNPKTGVLVPFQETMQRKRKYDIESKALEIPVKLFVFELLFLNGRSLLDSDYNDRKQELKKIIRGNGPVIYAQETIVKDAPTIEELFDKAVVQHFEGIIAKKLDGRYEAGMRGWNWIKYKKAMNRKLMDTVDVLVLGYTKGEGKRTDFGVGQFLTGVYDDKADRYVSVTKIGTGLTDEQFREFYKRVKKIEAKEKPALFEIDKLLEPDVWLTPALVVEVSCDEITRSPVHTAGRVMETSKNGKALQVKTPGFALRFPRLERFRDDKRPEDVTTVDEVRKMFEKQGS